VSGSSKKGYEGQTEKKRGKALRWGEPYGSNCSYGKKRETKTVLEKEVNGNQILEITWVRG